MTDYHNNLINIIKSDNRVEFYDIFEKILNNQITIKKYHLELCLSFLSTEHNLEILSRYFVLLIDFYKINQLKYDISSYPLIIRISSSLGQLKKSNDYLIEMENMKIPIKNRTISPMIESMSKCFLLNDNLEIDIFKTLVTIFDKYYNLFKTEQFYQLLICFKYYLHLEKQTDVIKSRMFKMFQIWNEIDFISDNKIVDILKSKNKEFVSIGYDLFDVNIIDSTCSRCNSKLKKHELSYLERDKLVDQLFKTYKNNTNHNNNISGLDLFKKYIESKSLDNDKSIFYIIDGGNVGHSSNGVFISDIVIQMLYNLESDLNKTSNLNKENIILLVILHKSHKKDFENEFINSTIIDSKIKDKVYIWYTPFKENDDIYWLLGSFMIENSFVITNDQMRDHHVDKLDEILFNRWKKNHIINYVLDVSFNKTKQINQINQIIFNFTFKYPHPYTVGFQSSEKYYHLPSYYSDFDKDIKWICFSK